VDYWRQMPKWERLRTLWPVLGGLQMLHRSHYRHTVAMWTGVLFCLLLGQSFGASFKAFGPQTFTRG